MACPDAESIAELISEQSDPSARAAFADHAAACESCHAVVEVLFDHTVAAQGSSAPDMPSKIDRYVVRRKLGAGGMGVVYVAHDPDLDREVAIKMLRRGVAASRLRREAQSLARLSHPNVVAVHDVGEHDGQVFVAMALVDGVNLRQWLRAPRESREILRVLLTAGRGIVAAHTAGLIHRDLKPDNIFVAATGDVLVGDFGLARDSDDAPDAGSLEGTPAYMPPEQAEGRANERSDQYSFCVTAFEALYGKRPFSGASFEEILENARAGRIAEVRGPGIDARVASALRRGLRAEPDDRFESMADLLRELEPRSRRWMWLAAAGVLAVGAAVTATWFATREDPMASAEQQCAAAGTPAWNPLMRGAVEAALRAQNNTPDAISEVATRLDRYASDWTEARRDACLAQVGGRETPARATARLACLGTRKTAFEITTASLIETPADIYVAWRRASTIPSPTACNSDDALRLSSGTAEHQALMRDLAIAVTMGGDALDALAKKSANVTDVPARLEIALVRAKYALDSPPRPVTADEALEIARPLAEQLDVASARVRAFALSARSYCIQSRNAEANHFLAMAVAGANRLRESEAEAEMDEVFLARTECMYRHRQPAELVPLLVDRIAYVQRRYGHGGFDEADLHQRLAQIYTDLDRRDDSKREYEAGRKILERFVKADEAAAVAEDGKSIEALQAGDLDGAIAHSRRSIEMYVALHHPQVGSSLVDLGLLLDLAQDRKAAVAAYSQALALIPEDSPDEVTRAMRAEALGNRGYSRLILEDIDLAITDLQASIDAAQKLGRADLVLDAQMFLGRAWVAKGEYERAVRVYRASLDVFAHSAKASPAVIAMSQFAYAQALWETGDHETARTLAKTAETRLAASLEVMRANPLATRAVPTIANMLSGIERWRDTHP